MISNYKTNSHNRILSGLSSQACQRRFVRSRRKQIFAQSSGGLRSFDSDDDLEISREFQNRIEVQQAMSAKKRLELLWAMQSKAKKSQVCGCCDGCGQQECEWCHGTGVLMVGDSLLCDTVSGSSKCNICKGRGYVNCDHCKGIGRVAGWMEPGCQLGT